MAEEDDFGTRYIIAKNVNTVYFQLIDPDCFTKREYSHITIPSERETETEKYDRYFYSIVKRVLG